MPSFRYMPVQEIVRRSYFYLAFEAQRLNKFVTHWPLLWAFAEPRCSHQRGCQELKRLLPSEYDEDESAMTEGDCRVDTTVSMSGLW